MGVCCLNLIQTDQICSNQQTHEKKDQTEPLLSIQSITDDNSISEIDADYENQHSNFIEVKTCKIITPHYETVKVHFPQLIAQSEGSLNNKFNTHLQQEQKINRSLSLKQSTYGGFSQNNGENEQEDEVSKQCRQQWGEGGYVNQCSLGFQLTNQNKDDTRYLNEQVDQYPYNCVGLLKSIARIGISRLPKPSIGTGFLISPNLVLTAAHNIIYKGVCNQSIIFYPMLHGKISSHEEVISVVSFYIPQQYRDGTDASFDYAILKLSKNVQRNKYIMIGQDYPDCNTATIYGYPIDKSNPIDNFFQQYGGKGKISYFEDGNIYYQIDTQKGQSGSPVIVQFIKGLYFVIGIHCKFRKSNKLNLGAHLTNSKVQVIQKWMLEKSPQSSYSIVDFSKINQISKYYEGKMIKSNEAIAQINLYLKMIFAEKSKDEVSQRLRFLLVEIGKKFRLSGDYQASMTYLKESLQVCKKIYPEHGKQSAVIYNQIGITYKAQHNYQNALQYYLLAANIYKTLGDNEHIAITFNNIGNCFSHLSQMKEAVECYRIAFQINRQYFEHHPQKFSNYYTNMGRVYFKNQQYQEAQKMYQQAFKIRNSLNKKDLELCRCYFHLAQCYLRLGSIKGDKSDAYFKKSISEHFMAIQGMIDIRLTRHEKFTQYLSGFKDSIEQISKSSKETIISALQVVQKFQKYDNRLVMIKPQLLKLL